MVLVIDANEHTTIVKIISLLKVYDPHYEYSDDMSRYRSGKNTHDALSALYIQLSNQEKDTLDKYVSDNNILKARLESLKNNL